MAKAVKVGIGFVFNAVSSLGSLCWTAVQNFAPLLTKAWDWIKGIAGVVSDMWKTVQGWIKPIWDFYRDNIKPVLDTVYSFIDTLKSIILAVEGRLDELWAKVTTEVLGPLNDVIKDISKIWTGIADVVSVFNAQLAEKMIALESGLTAKYKAAIDAAYDATIGKVKEHLDPVLRKLNELEALYNLYVKTFTDKLEKVGNIIDTTFEKPNVLKHDVLFTTSMHWGAGLWNDLFAGVTPTKPAAPSDEMVQLQVDPLVDKFIADVFAEKVEGWQDISKRIDEEIREKFYGELIPSKTQITVPKLPGGPGGKF